MTCIIFPKKTAERKFYINIYINADEKAYCRDDAHTKKHTSFAGSYAIKHEKDSFWFTLPQNVIWMAKEWKSS